MITQLVHKNLRVHQEAVKLYDNNTTTNMWVQLGIEFTEAEVNDQVISYCLIDLLILRIQVAWFKE